MTEQLVPEIRFQGFIEGWTRAALGAVAQLNPATTIPEEFQYVDLASVVGTQMISHRRESRATAPSRAQRLAREGDIFYQTVRPYQKNNVVFEGMSEPFVFSSGYAQIRTHLTSGYLFSAMQRPEFVNQVLDRCTGTSFPAISPTALGEVQVPLCGSLEEQRSIASTFVNLDDSIAQHQRKHRQLQQAKASLMQGMFPAPGATRPEIRLQGFAGAWTRNALGDLGRAVAGFGFPNVEQGGLVGTPFYKVSDMNLPGNARRMAAANNYVRPDQILHLSWKTVSDVPAIIFAKVGAAVFLGRKRIVDHPFLIDNNMMAFCIDRKLLDAAFAQTLFETVNLSSLVQVGALPSFNPPALESLSVWVPETFDEQREIGAFFRKLDDLIEAEAQYVSKLQQVKSALLQKMFV